MTGICAFMLGAIAAGGGAAPPSGGTLIVTTSPDYSVESSTSAGLFTPPVTTYVSGGSGSYSYAWTVVSEAAGSLGIRNPTSRTTGFYFTSLTPVIGAPGAAYGDAIARVTVTDISTGNTGYFDVSVAYTQVP